MSMDKLTPVKDESPDGTRYNDTPVNFKELTEEEFAKTRFDGQHIEYVEFRQMYNKKVSAGMIQARLFWFSDDTGVAISLDYWKGKVRYFSFGCNHELKVKNYEAGKSYHCSKCNTDIHEPWMDLIVSDSGWTMDEYSSIPIRGIRDYERTIRFKSALDTNQLERVRKFLSKTDCPGWTGVGVRDMGEGEYKGLLFKFNTTHDSSD